MGTAVQSTKATRDAVSPPPYHRARDCRAERGASPQHRGRPHSWVGGWSSCGSSGIGRLHSSGHTRTRDSSVTSLQALHGGEKGHMRDRAQAQAPPPPPCTRRPGQGPPLRQNHHREGPGKGTHWSPAALLTRASPQVAEAALLVSREDVGAPVPAGPWGTVGPQAALLAHPAASGARFPRGPGGPGTVSSHTARAGAQGQLCGRGQDRTEGRAGASLDSPASAR